MKTTLLMFAAVGCTGAPTPEPSPPGGPSVAPEAVPLVPPPPIVPVSVPADPSGRVQLEPALVEQIVLVKGEYDAISDVASFAQAWHDAVALGPMLEAAFQTSFERQDGDLDLAWLTPVLPGLEQTETGEGTRLVLQLSSEPWMAKAKLTPEPADDRFIELMVSVYGSAQNVGWAVWEQRTWDYGGCSGLGTGVVVETLKKTDVARDAGDAFAPEIAVIRRDALAVLLEDQPRFAYCDVETEAPMPDARLQDEARRVVAEVKLTPDEKAKVLARIPSLKGGKMAGDVSMER